MPQRLGHPQPFRVIKPALNGRADFDLYGEDWRELEALGARDLVIKTLTLGEELPSKVVRALDPDTPDG